MENRALEDLPILTKSILMENFDEVVTDRSIHLAEVDAHLKQDAGDGMFQGRYVALSTSGSTGQRGVFLFDTREWIECLASIARPMKWAGVAPNPFRRMRSAMLASGNSLALFRPNRAFARYRHDADAAARRRGPRGEHR